MKLISPQFVWAYLNTKEKLSKLFKPEILNNSTDTSKPSLEYVEGINRDAAHLTYKPDWLWGALDTYKMPHETWLKGGDCDDFAVWFYYELRERYKPNHFAIFNLVNSNILNTPKNHVILLVECSDGATYALDTNSASWGKPIFIRDTQNLFDESLLAAEYFGKLYKCKYDLVFEVKAPFGV